MADASTAVKIVIAIVITGLIAAFLMPIAVNAIAGPSTASSTLQPTNTTDFKYNLNVTLDSVDVSGATDNATYTINADGTTSTVTIDEGANTTTTVDNADIKISVTDVTSANATADYEYPTTYGWGGGAAAMWVILPVILVLGVFLYFVYLALDAM